MAESESQECHLAIAANGDDVHLQVELLEDELRNIHAQLDEVLCVVGSLLRSPAMTTRLKSALREALEPAAEAIGWGAHRLHEQVRCKRAIGGW